MHRTDSYVFRALPIRVALILSFASIASVAPAIAAAQKPAAATQPPAAQPPAAQPPASAQGALQPGDIIRLRIWREPDLSGDFLVDENGVATLPKLGPVSVVGQAVPALRTSLIERYGAFLRNTSIEVVPLRRVQVLGSVRNPGLYPVDPTMTVAGALAVAGGVSPDGKANGLQLFRDGRRLDVTIGQETRIADTPLRSGDQLFVPQRSWMSRNQWVFGVGISLTTSIIYAATR